MEYLCKYIVLQTHYTYKPPIPIASKDYMWKGIRLQLLTWTTSAPWLAWHLPHISTPSAPVLTHLLSALMFMRFLDFNFPSNPHGDPCTNVTSGRPQVEHGWLTDWWCEQSRELLDKQLNQLTTKKEGVIRCLRTREWTTNIIILQTKDKLGKLSVWGIHPQE